MTAVAARSLEDHFRIIQCMHWNTCDLDERGAFWMLFINVLDACALEVMKRHGQRVGALHVNASYLTLVKRLTRALDEATDPFDSTTASRTRLRVEWGL